MSRISKTYGNDLCITVMVSIWILGIYMKCNIFYTILKIFWKWLSSDFQWLSDIQLSYLVFIFRRQKPNSKTTVFHRSYTAMKVTSKCLKVTSKYLKVTAESLKVTPKCLKAALKAFDGLNMFIVESDFQSDFQVTFRKSLWPFSLIREKML